MICNSNKIYFNWNYWPWTLTTGQDLRYTKGWGCPDSWPSNVGEPAWFCKCHEESSVNISVIRNKVSVLCINVSVQLWSSEANNHILSFSLFKKKKKTYFTHSNSSLQCAHTESSSQLPFPQENNLILLCNSEQLEQLELYSANLIHIYYQQRADSPFCTTLISFLSPLE